jgi:hypothetical protein
MSQGDPAKSTPLARYLSVSCRIVPWEERKNDAVELEEHNVFAEIATQKSQPILVEATGSLQFGYVRSPTLGAIGSGTGLVVICHVG